MYFQDAADPGVNGAPHYSSAVDTHLYYSIKREKWYITTSFTPVGCGAHCGCCAVLMIVPNASLAKTERMWKRQPACLPRPGITGVRLLTFAVRWCWSW